MATTTQILRGLEIIEKYEPGSELSIHGDAVFAGSEALLFKMTEEEAQIMAYNAWFIDEDFGCWCHID